MLGVLLHSKPLQDGKEETALVAHNLVISGMGIPSWSIPNLCVLGAPGLAGPVAPVRQLLPVSPGHQVFREPQCTAQGIWPETFCFIDF